MPARKKIKKVKDLVLPDFARYFFVFAVITILALFFWVIGPFFDLLIYAALIAIIFYPMQKYLEKFLKGHKGVAAFLTTFSVIVLLFAPLTLFGIFIAQEAVDAFQLFEAKLTELDLDSVKIGQLLDQFFERHGFAGFLNEIDVDFFKVAQDIGEAVSTFIVNQTTTIVKSLADTMVALFILLLTLFFFLRDGDRVIEFIKSMSPLPKKYEDEIEGKLKATTYGILVGGFGTAFLQGIAGGMGFLIAGVNHVIFWTTIMTFSALIPYVGASLIWAPVALVLLIQGNTTWGIFLGLWGLFVVSSLDNFARPYLIGSHANMHPLPTFLVVLGGLLVFGLKGMIFGPLILGLTITVIHIYQLEYREVLK
jgi:predicted PurR-regulated permease PerM